MLKYTINGRSYWVGHNPQLGYLIYDPLVQSGEKSGFVRMFVVDRGRSCSLKKDVIKSNLTRDAALDKNQCELLLMPYAKARKKLRVTHCFSCRENLSTSDFGICTNCGWIQCSCGACGCVYSRA